MHPQRDAVAKVENKLSFTKCFPFFSHLFDAEVFFCVNALFALYLQLTYGQKRRSMSALELRNVISKDISTMPVPMLESLSRYIKMLLNSSTDDEVSEKERDALFLASVSGKWEDSRSADEMVKDIYASRTERDDAELVSAFSE